MNSSKLALFAFLGVAAASASLAQSPPTAAPAPAPAPAPAASAPAAAPPAKSADAMDGLAAVYSDKLNGRKTASGQVFHQSDLTAAHPSLAFGTKVKVTNKNNNKSVEVRINDRGPHPDRSCHRPVERGRGEDRHEEDQHRARHPGSRRRGASQEEVARGPRVLNLPAEAGPLVCPVAIRFAQ